MTFQLVKSLFGNKSILAIMTLTFLLSCASKHDHSHEEETQTVNGKGTSSVGR